MAKNDTEIRHAIKFMLKRYDLIGAWKQMLPIWIVNPLFAIIYTVFILWFLLSVAAFAPTSVFLGIPLHIHFLVLFACYPLQIFAVIFTLVLSLRSVLYKRIPMTGNPLADQALLANRDRTRIIERIKALKPKFGKELILIGVIFAILIYTLGYYSLIVILPVIALMILPTLFKTFYFSIFLPRIVITVSYVWVSFIFTEENTRFMQSLPDNAYILGFIIGTFGSIAFLWFESQQNAPSVRKSELLIRRVMPVFAYAVFISILLGIIFETTGNDKKVQATSDESYYFRSDMNILNTTLMKLNSLKEYRNIIEDDWQSLPDISMEVGFQKIEKSYPYSRIYNSRLEWLKLHINNYNNVLCGLINSNETDTLLISLSRSKVDFKVPLSNNTFTLNGIDSIPRVNSFRMRDLQKQIDQFNINNKILQGELFKQDTILRNFEHVLINFYDTLATKKSELIVRRLSGYDLFKRVKDTPEYSISDAAACLYKKQIMNNNKSPDETSTNELFFTEYPVFVWGNISIATGFNLKRFLIQVIIAVAIGVVGQLILAEKTVTEPV